MNSGGLFRVFREEKRSPEDDLATAAALKHVVGSGPPITLFGFTVVLDSLQESMLCHVTAVVAVQSLDLAGPSLLRHASYFTPGRFSEV